ncbi:MAG: hypothetical protein JRI91_12420 [Deltaproteobacteria bacterium]|nr:hypothetical protein [Deltaproteobacteria bacterium]
MIKPPFDKFVQNEKWMMGGAGNSLPVRRERISRTKRCAPVSSGVVRCNE